nr:unnamed protein product [Callosobruchus chinensis]
MLKEDMMFNRKFTLPSRHVILAVFLSFCFTLSGATSGKGPSKRSIITAYPDASRFAEVFRTRDSSDNILEKFLEDKDNKEFTITKNGDYLFQIPLMEHESSEDYYDYDESENANEDERNSNEIDKGSANKETVRRNEDAMEVPEYIVKFFIEQKMLREQREKENKCKDKQPEAPTTTFVPFYDDSDFFMQTNDQFSLETVDDATYSDTEVDEVDGQENEEDLEDQIISTTEAQPTETTFQNHVTSSEATPITTAPSKAPHPRWNSMKNIFSSVSNYELHPSGGSLIQNVDSFISKIFSDTFRNKRSALGKKPSRRSFRDLLYQIVPRQYAKRYIAPKYFPKTDLVTSEVYPVLTKKILEDLPKETIASETKNLGTMEQFRTLEDIFKDEGRRNRRNKRPIDVGSFEQVF